MENKNAYERDWKARTKSFLDNDLFVNFEEPGAANKDSWVSAITSKVPDVAYVVMFDDGPNYKDVYLTFSDEVDDYTSVDYIDEVNVHPGVRECGTSHVVNIYDSLYLKLIRALWDAEEYNRVEEVALSWRTKINNDMSWVDAGTYTYLKSKYKDAGEDFSILKSEYDWDE